jgi:hypothetical protein
VHVGYKPELRTNIAFMLTVHELEQKLTVLKPSDQVVAVRRLFKK